MSEYKSVLQTRRKSLGMLGCLPLMAGAQTTDSGYPSRAIKLLLPFSAGSSTDFTARLVAEQLTRQLKQAVVVENRPGAAGVIGTQMLARSAPDGYTIGLVSVASLAMAPPTLKDMPYDPVNDFEPLTILTNTDLILVAGPGAKGKSVAEFVQWARSQKDPVFMGTLGAGTSGHFAGFMFGQAAGIQFESVHFKSFSDLMPAMLNGSIHFSIMAPSPLVGFIREGRLSALATNGAGRLRSLADVPTFREVGYPDMEFMLWVGLAAPAKTPPAILNKLNAELVQAVRSPAVSSKLLEGGFAIVANSREDFAAIVRKDVVAWRNMIKNTGFKV
jgi:tripartite-type tricarboxylate transporter receptor subunit TctC